MSKKKVTATVQAVDFPSTTSKVGQLATQVRGVTYSKHEASSVLLDGYVPILRATNISEHGLTFDDLVYVPSTRVNERQMLQPGDIVIAASSGSLEIVGKAGVVERPLSASFGAFCKVRPESAVYPAYLGHFFRTHGYKSIISKLAQGANINNLKNEHLNNLEILLPPLDEQKRIAAVLDKADALRRQRQESLQLTEKLLQSVFIDMFGDLRTNPLGWPEISLGEVISNGPQNGLYQPQSDYGTGTRILRIDGFYDGAVVDEKTLRHLRLRPGNKKQYLLKEGDIVINRVNSLEYLGKSAVIPKFSEAVVFESNMMRIGINTERLLPRFLITLLQDPYIRHQIASCAKKAVNQASINQTDVKGLRIFEPPVSLQEEYIRHAEFVENFLKQEEESGERANDLFASLQQRAFRGELDLSRLTLDAEVESSAVTTSPEPEAMQGRYKRPGSFTAPPDIEAQMLALEDRLDAGPGDSIPWSEDYFKYRTLSQVLQPPFSFADIWEAVEYDMAEASYESVKDKVFEYVGEGTLEQRFDEERKEIVFQPRP